jgi:N,N'-diacetyllegionaminate synthase
MHRPSEVIHIAGREVRRHAPAFLIAEVAQAHDGSLGFAHSFIDIVADAGADAIKFQTQIATAESTLDEKFRIPFSYEDATRWDYWRRMEFSAPEWEGLARHAREKGLIFLSSCFSVEAVEMLRRLGVPAWKVGSGEADSTELLDAMAAGGEPILISTGISDFAAIARQVERISSKQVPVALFQCTTKYPTSLEEVGLNVIDALYERFGCPVGLSDHSGSIWPSVAAMARGAALIEVHIAMHRLQFGPDTAASLDPAQLRQLVDARDAMVAMLTHPVDKDTASRELADTRRLFGKSLTLKEALPAGTMLRAEHLTLKKPGGGLGREAAAQLIGRRLAHAVPANRLLQLDDLEPDARPSDPPGERPVADKSLC